MRNASLHDECIDEAYMLITRVLGFDSMDGVVVCVIGAWMRVVHNERNAILEV